MADAGELIGGYKVRSLLGATGAKSQVFEVIEPNSGRHFAMKILLPEYFDNKEERAILFHEAEVGIKMRHENVVNILKVNKSPTQPHFIMEFFPSGSLRPKMNSKDPRDKQFLRQNAKKIARQVATGLAYMNASGWVHCDVKLDNILCNALAQVKIIDFAISKKSEQGFLARLFRGKRRPQGTASFMSPEQIRDDALDGRADIYSYGATMYELVTGRPPFRAASMAELFGKHFTEAPQTPQVHNPDVTDEFAALILKTLAKKKEQRPENFHEVLIELKKIRVFKSIIEEEADTMS